MKPKCVYLCVCVWVCTRARVLAGVWGCLECKKNIYLTDWNGVGVNRNLHGICKTLWKLTDLWLRVDVCGYVLRCLMVFVCFLSWGKERGLFPEARWIWNYLLILHTKRNELDLPDLNSKLSLSVVDVMFGGCLLVICRDISWL